MRFRVRWPARLPTLGIVALLVCAFVVAGCGTTTATTGPGGAPPTATTAPTAAPTNTAPAPTNTPSGPQAAVSITTSGGAYGSSFGFSPSSLSIKAGTTVTWTDKTGAPHTVTSDAGDPASFNGSLGGNGATYSFTFTTPGTYNYHCSIHPYMTATITVTM
jgi:plastocyanin